MNTKTKSFIISFFWICLGTLMQISSYPANNFLNFDYNSATFLILYSITLPFNIIVFGLMFSEKLENIYWLIIIIQTIKVFLYSRILYRYMTRKERTKNR